MRSISLQGELYIFVFFQIRIKAIFVLLFVRIEFIIYRNIKSLKFVHLQVKSRTCNILLKTKAVPK